MTQGVKIIDKGWNKISDNMQKLLKGKFAVVGIQGSQAGIDHDGLTNAEIGSVHEFGSEDGMVPERSYMRSTFDEQQSALQKEVDEISKRVLSGKGNIDGELLLLGETYKAAVVNKIKQGIPPALAEGSEREGSAPLWATGQLVNSLSTTVENRELGKEAGE